MAAVAGHTLSFGHRFMLHPVPGHPGFDILMAGKADLARLILDEAGLIGPVGAVARKAFSFRKRRMGRFFSLFNGQVFMACQAKLTIVNRNHKQTLLVTPMGIMAA